jgi:hypothetical protein
MNVGNRRNWLVLPAAGTLALLLSACGGPSVGDVEGQVLAMRDAAQQPVLLAGASVILAGNGVNCGVRPDRCVAQTDAEGKYRFTGIPSGDYGIAFNPPNKEGEPKLQAEQRQFNVSANAVETVSVVLLAEGITPPAVPAELQQRGAAARNDPGLMGNPFFWYFMFNQPWLGGYTRPPVLVYGPGSGPDRPVVASPSQPAAPAGRSYTNYGPPGTPGTKGVARPGQAPSGGTTANASRPGTGGSSATGSNQSPPRVGAGGGGTAGRSSSPPPRVRVGRR